MVEYKNSPFDDRTEDDPPLVQALHLPLNCAHLEPISVSVVTIDGECQEGVSVVSSESYSMVQEGATAETEEEYSDEGSSKSLKSGLTGGLVGTLIGGPILGVVAGGACAHYSKKEGAAGDVSRAIGELGSASFAKAKELNRKHNLVDKSKEAATSAVQRAKELNQQHHLLNKGKEAAATAFERAQKFNKKHNVVKRLAAFIMLCLKELAKIAEQVGGRLQEGEATKHLVAESNTERIPQATASIY